jgi:dTDP-4-dehydrorhamnose reductase
VAIEFCDDHLIGRVCVLYGWSLPGAKKNFVEWVIGSLKGGKDLNLLDDQFVTPTYAGSAAKILFGLVERDKKGVFHVSGKECINRYEMGMKVAKKFGLDGSLVKPAKLEDMNFSAQRPENSCLNTGKVEKELNIRLGSFDDDLSEMRMEQKEEIS